MGPKEISAFVTPKSFFASTEYDGEKFELEVQTPDLSDVEPTVDGDWGPTYYFNFDAPRSVRVIQRSADGTIVAESAIELSRIVLDSPMIYSERQEFPLYLRFADGARGIEFAGHLDVKGEPAHLAMKQLPLKDKTASLLLFAPALPQSSGWAEEDQRIAS